MEICKRVRQNARGKCQLRFNKAASCNIVTHMVAEIKTFICCLLVD